MVGLQGSLVRYSLPPCKSRPVPIPMRLYHLGPPNTHSCLASGWLGPTSSAPSDDLGGGFLDDDPWVAAAFLRLTGGLTNETPTYLRFLAPAAPKLPLQSCSSPAQLARKKDTLVHTHRPAAI